MNQLLTELVLRAVYCRVTGVNGWDKYHSSSYTPLHKDVVGLIEHQERLNDSSNYSFSVNCSKSPGWEKSGTGVHHWVYPYKGDSVVFYDTNGSVLGSWNGATQQLNTEDPANTTDIEGAKKLFKSTTVKAKGGYRAQVTFNDVVVWEADTVYTDDVDYQAADYDNDIKAVGQSGQSKAQKAAAKAVDQAVEALFAKVKV